MTGPEHYREAEKLLAAIEITPEASVGSVRTVAAMAQVHATLALAAATALGNSAGIPQDDYYTWDDTAGVHLARGEHRAMTGKTPGKVAHDAYCADDDWDTLTEAEHDLWVTVEREVLEAAS